MVKERLGSEDSSSIHQVVGIRMRGVDSEAQRVHLGHVREIGLFASYEAEVAQFVDGCRDAIVATSDHDSRAPRWRTSWATIFPVPQELGIAGRR